jgi:hypothetical protein
MIVLPNIVRMHHVVQLLLEGGGHMDKPIFVYKVMKVG